MLIKIRNDLYDGWRGRWCLRKIEEVRLVKSKLLMCHITVQRRNMTSNTAGVAVTAMRAVTVIIGIERKRIKRYPGHVSNHLHVGVRRLQNQQPLRYP